MNLKSFLDMLEDGTVVSVRYSGYAYIKTDRETLALIDHTLRQIDVRKITDLSDKYIEIDTSDNLVAALAFLGVDYYYGEMVYSNYKDLMHTIKDNLTNLPEYV